MHKNDVFWFCETSMLPAHMHGCTWSHNTLDIGYFHKFCCTLIVLCDISVIPFIVINYCIP